MGIVKPPRTTWADGFPNVVLHATKIVEVKKHKHYEAAKSGNEAAAEFLVQDTVSDVAIARLKSLLNSREVHLVSAHAQEATGINAIPEAMAAALASRLNLPLANEGVFQINKVGHTGASGFVRLARQAAFGGPITQGQDYLLVDDFVGQGGTLANLKGYIETSGGRVVAATVLTGREDSAALALQPDQLSALRAKHGRALEDWWQAEFGHRFDCLTNSEARYLSRIPDADTVRTRIAAAQAA